MASLNVIQLIFLVVLGQGLFLTLVLTIHNKGDKRANRLLAIAVFLMTYFTFVFLLNDTGYRRYVPILILNGYSITPLIPVAFYFYFKRLTYKPTGKHYWLHFIPFIIQFLYWLPNNTHGLFFDLSQDTLSTFYSMTIVRSVSGIHILLFLSYGFVFFRKMKFSAQTAEKLRWLQKIRMLYIIMAFTFTIGLFSIWFTNTEVIRYLFFLFLSLFIYLIGYYGYVKSEFLFPAGVEAKPKYFHSQLSNQQSELIYQKLLALMSDEKPYLRSAVKLADVAELMNVTQHHLSRVINENYGGSFIEFINKYRIEEAKSILKDRKKESYKMIAVALDAGFGNKVSFYKNFKKFTGSLPGEFRNHKD